MAPNVQETSAPATKASDKPQTKYAIVKDGWGSRTNFQLSHGLKMEPGDLEEGNKILDEYIKYDEWLAEERMAEEQMAEERMAEERMAEEQSAEEQMDEQYVDEQYMDEQYMNEPYTGEEYADEEYVDED